MLYSAFEVQKTLLAGASAFADAGAEWWSNPANPFAYFGSGHQIASALEVFAHAAAPRGKPAFGLSTTVLRDGRTVAVTEEIVARKAFGQLRHFVREAAPADDARLLIVAPMSGHFATLLRGTVERMLPGHDVWITDWRDARSVPLSDGRFDLDDYIDYIIGWLEFLGPDTHVLAVCQPSVPVYAAACLMSAQDNPARPRTLTMMGGPIDTREAPTVVNQLAQERSLSWFENNVLATVPPTYAGAGRRVYPGFMQLAGFMSMNLGNHMMSHWRMFRHLVEGDEESAEGTKAFYDEYRSVCDMTAEFYLQTVQKVFQQHALPRRMLMHRDQLADPAAIKDIGLLAIEGENDDISGLGQTRAALDIATNLPKSYKKYHMARAVGHYGIFHGGKWRRDIAPVVEGWIAEHRG